MKSNLLSAAITMEIIESELHTPPVQPNAELCVIQINWIIVQLMAYSGICLNCKIFYTYIRVTAQILFNHLNFSSTKPIWAASFSILRKMYVYEKAN